MGSPVLSASPKFSADTPVTLFIRRSEVTVPYGDRIVGRGRLPRVTQAGSFSRTSSSFGSACSSAGSDKDDKPVDSVPCGRTGFAAAAAASKCFVGAAAAGVGPSEGDFLAAKLGFADSFRGGQCGSRSLVDVVRHGNVFGSGCVGGLAWVSRSRRCRKHPVGRSFGDIHDEFTRSGDNCLAGHPIFRARPEA